MSKRREVAQAIVDTEDIGTTLKQCRMVRGGFRPGVIDAPRVDGEVVRDLGPEEFDEVARIVADHLFATNPSISEPKGDSPFGGPSWGTINCNPERI